MNNHEPYSDTPTQFERKKPMKSILNLRVDEEIFVRFRELAKASGIRQSEMFRRIITDYLTEGNERETAWQIPENANMEMKSLSIRMPEFVIGKVRSRASAQGMLVSHWLSALVRANLTQNPVMPYEELCALKETNYELAAIGRNLNQMVRAMHTGGYSQNRVTPEFIAEISKHIQEVRDNLDALIRCNHKLWSTGNANGRKPL